MTHVWIVAALFTGCGGGETRNGPQLELGRTAVKNVSLAANSVATRPVRLENKGDAVARLVKVTLEGDPLTLEIWKEKACRTVAFGEQFEYEIAAQTSVRLDVKVDAKGQKLGAHQAKLTFESDGAKPLVLPVEWEVVEPTKEEDDDAPIPKPKKDWRELETTGPPPKIVCNEYKHDFGKISQGEQLKTKITLRNEGDGDLWIVKVGIQCHCTLPKLTLPDRELDGRKLKLEEAYGKLKPGEEATLEVNVDTSGLGGMMHKRLDVYTNDLARNPTTITLTAIVDNPFRFSPASVNLVNGVPRGVATERIVRMSSIDQGEFTITGHSMKEPAPFRVDYRKVTPQKGEQCAWELVLTTRTDLPCGRYDGKLTLELDHPRIKSCSQLSYAVKFLPDVAWSVKNDARPSPETFTYGMVKPGVNDVKTIVFENRNASVPWKPSKVTVTSPHGDEPFTAEVVEVEAGQRYEVNVKVAHAPKVKMFKGVLRVDSESGAMPSLTLPFTGFWTEPPPTPPPASEPPKKEGGR